MQAQSLYATSLRSALAPGTPARPGLGRVPAGGLAIASAGCGNCSSRHACLASGLDPEESALFQQSSKARLRLKSGESLFAMGDVADTIYAMRSGFVMTSISNAEGARQVTDFHLAGDVLGLEAIAGGRYVVDAIALEDTEVCVVPRETLLTLAQQMPGLQKRVYELFRDEMVREREALMLVGSMRAEDRLAVFLLDLGARYAERGFSAVRFVLRMSRAELGSYLGLRLETVSRLFSKLQAEGILKVDGKSIEISDVVRLRAGVGRYAH